MEETPNYYAIIPANVRYDNELRANEKLLYGEITALTSKTGECWASNEYFAKLYGKSKDTVSDWISRLNKKGYIKVQLIRNSTTKEIEKRIIRINYSTENAEGVSVKMPIGYRQKCLEGIGKNTVENNTRKNNINNNNIQKYYGEYQNVFFTEEQYQKLINEFPKDFQERIQKLDDYMQSTGKKYKDCLATIRMWARKENKPTKVVTTNKSNKSLDEKLSELTKLFEEEEINENIKK